MMATLAPRRPAGCPSDLALDEMAAGDLQDKPGDKPGDKPEEARLRTHVASCARCRERLATRAADPSFSPSPAALARHARPAQGEGARGPAELRRRTRVRVVGAAMAIASAAAGLLLWSRPPAPPPAERTKGALALTVHVKRASSGAIERFTSDGRVRSGDEVRFSLTIAEPGYAVVLGLDATPAAAVYVPAGGAGDPVRVEPQGGPVSLPGSVIPDDAAGFERVTAVVCTEATAPEMLRREAQAALTRAGGRPESVSSLGTGCLESSVLLRKEGREEPARGVP